MTRATATPLAPASAWAPLRHPLYRALWTAQLASNIGTWMQTVGAQWLMGSLGGGALEVALVQAAIAAPIFIVALPAGALGDIVDRRRLLLVSHAIMVTVAGVLAFVTFTDLVTPSLLLGLTFALGLGQGLTLPAWQATMPEVVERREIPLAAALAGVNNNLARAVGPAVGGLLVAAAGPEWTFALNAISFVGTAAVLAAWRRPQIERVLGPEHVPAAMRLGLAYVRHEPELRAVFWRALIFASLGGALWAVLPVLVRDDLGLGSGGYGLLLADVGVGAIFGAVATARMRHERSGEEVLVASSVLFAVVSAVCAVLTDVVPVALALIVAGGAWIGATSTLNGTAIAALPGWIRSRGAALYTLVFQLGLTIAAVLWGAVAEIWGARTALGAVGAAILLMLVIERRWRMPDVDDRDVSPKAWPFVPSLEIEPHPDAGPILVTVEYPVLAEHHDAFRERMHEVGRVRRRTGAEDWGLFQDGADPDRFVETFLVPTWRDHLRQHLERGTAADRAALEQAAALSVLDGPPLARHLFFAYWEQ